MTRVAIRADSSLEIGLGHLMRCLTLARGLRERGVEVVFVCRDLPGARCDLARQAGFEVLVLPEPAPSDLPDGTPSHARWLGVSGEIDAEQVCGLLRDEPCDWMVVDSYALDERWETAVRAVARGIVAIDDLADRPHDADVLLDQNLSSDGSARYEALVRPGCLLLLGQRYALLREEFGLERRRLRDRDGSVTRVLVSFGGADVRDQTSTALRALAQVASQVTVDVVVPVASPNAERVRAAVGAFPAAMVHFDTDRMAELMHSADLALGASASASWERCFLGLPAITAAIADNQVGVGRELAKTGAVLHLGVDPTQAQWADAVARLVSDPAIVREMSRCGLDLMRDTLTGAQHPLVGVLTGQRTLFDPRWVVLRPLAEADLPLVLEWRNQERIRDAMLTQHVIGFAEHRGWYDCLVATGAVRVYMLELLGRPVGTVNFDFRVDRERPQWGFYLGENDVPRGTGRLLCLEGLQAVFEDRTVLAVTGVVLPSNAASVRLHEELGFARGRQTGNEPIAFELTRAVFETRRRTLASGLLA